MTPKNRKNKLNKATVISITAHGTYYFNDAPGIALKVSRKGKKSFYGSYAVKAGVTPDGKIKYSGRYTFICRDGQMLYADIKKHVAANIDSWKDENRDQIKGNDVSAVCSKFINHLQSNSNYRLKLKSGKLKFKDTTSSNYIRCLNTYVLLNTDNQKTIERATAKVRINGEYNTDVFKNIKLKNITRRNVMDYHERFKDVPTLANRILSAISAAFTFDIQSSNPLNKTGINPSMLIAKFPEKKDKRYLKIEKVLEITDYIKNNLWRDPHFLSNYNTKLEIGERISDVDGIAWKEPSTESDKLKTTGWIINLNEGSIYLRDSKDREAAIVFLTDEGIEVLKKLQQLRLDPDSNAAWSIGSMYVWPRSSDPSKHVNYTSYRKNLEVFNYKFGLATRELVRATGKRKLYKYKNLFTFKHLRKTFVTHFGNKHGLQAASERMRHSSPKITKDHYYTQEVTKHKVKSVYGVGDNVVQMRGAK